MEEDTPDKTPDKDTAPEAEKPAKEREVIPKEERPIDKHVWFKLSREWVTKSEQRLENQAKAIQATIAWFFGLGTSATIFGFFWKPEYIGNVKIGLFVIPLVLFLFSYALATVSTIYQTLGKKILPNSQDSIREQFNKANSRGRALIIASASCLLLAMGSVLLPLMFPKTPKVEKPKEYLMAVHSETINSKKKKLISQVSISGKLPTKETVMVFIEKGSSILNSNVVKSFPVPLKSDSTFGTTLELKDTISLLDGENLMVAARYKSDKNYYKAIVVQSEKATN